jgi:hypothetical protein
MAVAYHFFNDFDTAPVIEGLIRKTYDGPLSSAVDYMVWNVTKDEIRVRMAVIIKAAYDDTNERYDTEIPYPDCYQWGRHRILPQVTSD